MSATTANLWVRWREQNASRVENWQRGLYRFRQSRLSIVGLAIVAFILLVALVGPFFVPYPQDALGAIHVRDRFQGPSAAHWFGTDELGHDIFTLVVVGSRVSLSVGVIVLIVATIIGVILGALAGYFGGLLNEVIMRVTDIFLTVPSLILALAIAAALGASIRNMMLAISLVWWPGYCRLVQAEVASRKQDLYVQAARASGASHWRIIFVHILPNITSPIVVKMSLDMGFAILTAAALGFVGVGAQPPTPEWGAMLSAARSYLPQRWWYPIFPGVALFLTVFGFNLLGDGLRDVLDPRARR
jgi:peptide/nickel transport system permease protein